MATVDVSAQVRARGAIGERGQVGTRNTGCPTRRAR